MDNNNNNELVDDEDVFNKINNEIYKDNPDINIIIDIINNHPNFNINMKYGGFSLLYHAVAVNKDEYEIVEYLVDECNVDIHIRNNNNGTPIMLSKSSKVLIFLIDNGANMYDVDSDGWNILMHAVYWDHRDVIETLINKYDYNIDMKDNDNKNRTAFHYYYCNYKEKYDNLVSLCKNNDLNRIYVLQEFIDIGCVNNNDDISLSIQGISYNEAHERALQVIGNNNEKDDKELLRRQIAIEHIPPLFNTQKGSMFDYRLVGMIFEYINTIPLIPEWAENE